MRIEIAQIFTQIVSFLVMFWVLKRYAWKPLLSLLDERRNKIQSEFDEIASQKKDIDKLNEDYRERLKEIDSLAKSKMQEAINEGKHVALEIQQDAHAKAQAIISQARMDLQGEILKAKEQFKTEIINMVMTATEKVLDTKLDKEKQNDLMKNLINKM